MRLGDEPLVGGLYPGLDARRQSPGVSFGARFGKKAWSIYLAKVSQGFMRMAVGIICDHLHVPCKKTGWTGIVV